MTAFWLLGYNGSVVKDEKGKAFSVHAMEVT
jgi:hypothetical protein